jgi:hypothetical protein
MQIWNYVPTGNMVFGVGNSEKVRITAASGNVGIDTTAPTALLSLGSSYPAKKLNVYENAALKAYAGFGVPGDGTFRSYMWSNGQGFTWGNVSVNDGTTFTELMRLTTGGELDLSNGNIYLPSASALKTSSYGRFWSPGLNLGTMPYSGIGADMSYNVYLNNGWKAISTGRGSLLGVAEGRMYFSNTNAFSAANEAVTWYYRFVIDTDGNVGIGTTQPALVGGSTDKMLEIQGAVNPGLAIHNTATNGRQYFIYSNDAGTGSLRFYDATAALDRIYINSDGKIGIGNSTPGYTLSVSGTIWANGSAIANGALTWSDARWKKDIKPLGGSLAKVEKLQGVSYDWETKKFPDRNFPKGRQIGLIAQEVEKIYPEMITEDKDGYKLLSYDKMSAVLIEAVKELSAEVKALKQENTEIKSKLGK